MQFIVNLDEYQRSGRRLYDEFATVVAELLERAIRDDPKLRLQQIQHRAKTVKSLAKRLNEVNECSGNSIEKVRKDLAGCRAIFYTNHDVNKFVNSGILQQLFDIEWERSRIHHPHREGQSTGELFQSINYVVKLMNDRTALMEYAKFEGLLCEVQVQTTLNHAWAEMEHDTIYKRPTSPGFGTKELKQIEEKLRKVMRQYLLPAGHIFQSIASDVQRLSEGKALFDADILNSVVSAKNNNDRHSAVVRLKENVLPNYDDLQSVYPEIRAKLKEAWIRAELIEPVPFEGTFGVFGGGFEAHQVTAEIAAIITRYRYIEPGETYVLIRDLYFASTNVESRKQLIRAAELLASHNLQIWKQYGPVIQMLLADLLSRETDLVGIAPVAIAIANKILAPHIEGTNSSSRSVTISRGAIVHSKDLERARKTVIEVISKYAEIVVDNDSLLLGAIDSLFSAGRVSQHGAASADAIAMICSDVAYVIELITGFVNDASLSSRQSIESRLLERWRWNNSLPPRLSTHSKVSDAQKEFVDNTNKLREILNEDEEFVVFKTIVGYESVLPHMWVDSSVDFNRDQAMRRNQQEQLAASITDGNWTIWKNRLAKTAEIQSFDLMTFPPLVQFLAMIADKQPVLTFDLLVDREIMPSWTIPPIAEFLIDGVMQADTYVLLNSWLDKEQFIQEIAALIARSKLVDKNIVERTTKCAIFHEDMGACVLLLQAASYNFKDNQAYWLDQVFFPCLEVLRQSINFHWIERIRIQQGEDCLIPQLTKVQCCMMLEAMVDIPRVSYQTELILESIAQKHHKLVLDWFGQRIKNSSDRSSMDYEPIPFSFHTVHKVLQMHAADVTSALREWWNSFEGNVGWRLSDFLSRVFPNFENPLQSTLLAVVAEGNRDDLVFVSSSLQGYNGRKELLPLLRSILASEAVTKGIEDKIAYVIHETGVVSGEFGFAQAYKDKADMLKSWLDDTCERVSVFAKREIHKYEQEVALEVRRAQEQIAMRKLEHEEPLDIDEEPEDDGSPEDNEN